MVRQREHNEPEPSTHRDAKPEEPVEGETDQEVIERLRDQARKEDAGTQPAAPPPPVEPAKPEPKKRARRGFAAMDPELRREIARRGGAASHEHGRAHEWSAEEARGWARQGGRIAHARGKAHEWSSEEAREAGRRGGLARWGRERRAAEEAAKKAAEESAPKPEGYQADAEETADDARLGTPTPEATEREPRARSSWEEEQLGRQQGRAPSSADDEPPPKRKPTRGRR